eukprot:3635-Chlamydomonas_euryale.AAC.1
MPAWPTPTDADPPRGGGTRRGFVCAHSGHCVSPCGHALVWARGLADDPPTPHLSFVYTLILL